MKFLIAGFGSIGRRHIRNLLALGEEDIIVYRTGRSTLPVDELKGMRVESDFDAALAACPDAVIIANPTSLHLDVAIPAAEAGCHLFLEKPISDDLVRLDELKRALEQSGKQAFVGFQFRFHPGLRKVKSLLGEGAIGKPLSARAHWGEYLRGWHPWEDYRKSYSARSDLGGGVTLTLCHPLDYLRWLMGEVESLWAFTGKLSDLEIEVEDVAEIGMRFAGGALGTVHLNYYQRPPVHRLEIAGTEGTLLWNNDGGAVQLYRAGDERWDAFPAPDGFERNHLFLAEMRHFIEVIKCNELPLCTLEDGEKALQLALLALESTTGDSKRV